MLHFLLSAVIIVSMEPQSNIQNNSNNQNNLTKDLPNKSFLSRYFWPLILILIIALATGYWLSQKDRATDPDLSLSPNEVEQLPADQQKGVLEKQLQDLLGQEKALTSESDRGDRFTVYIQLGEVYTALGRHDEALAVLDKLKEERSGNTRLWMTYAQVYKNKNSLPEARANVRMALDIDPELAQNWLFMLGILEDLDKPSQESIYKEALQRSGNLPEIQAAYQAWQQSNQQ